MRPCQDDTDGFCLVLADLAAQPGRVDAVLYRLGTVGHSFREPDQLTVEMCPVGIGIVGDIFIPLGILIFLTRVIPAATLQVADRVLCIAHICSFYGCHFCCKIPFYCRRHIFGA